MIRILHIIPGLKKGGAERLVLNICCELGIRENVKVKLVTFHSQNEYVELTEGLDWKVIPSVYIPSLTGKPTKDIIGLQQYIEAFQPDIIHTHLWEAEIVSRQIHYPKAEWFTHFHDNMLQLSKFFKFSKKNLTNFYEKYLMLKKYKRCNNQFICISNDTLQYSNHVLPSFFYNNTHLLYNAIDVKRFTRKNSEYPKELKLVTIGSLVDKKNQQFIIKVVNILKAQEPFVHLEVLGEGPNVNLLKEQIATLHLESYIFMKGNVNNVEEFLWQSAIYVHSATYEPFGLVLIEAMAAGLPVVCLDGKGNRTIIEQGRNGFMVYEQNPELFAAKILEIWHNKELYHSMSTFAVEYAKQYDIKEYTDKLLHLYREALKA